MKYLTNLFFISIIRNTIENEKKKTENEKKKNSA